MARFIQPCAGSGGGGAGQIRKLAAGSPHGRWPGPASPSPQVKFLPVVYRVWSCEQRAKMPSVTKLVKKEAVRAQSGLTAMLGSGSGPGGPAAQGGGQHGMLGPCGGSAWPGAPEPSPLICPCSMTPSSAS